MSLAIGRVAMLNDYMFTCNLSDSPNCDCGSERETVEHFLLRCEIYKELREQLLSTVHDVWEKGNPNRTDLQVSINLVLVPELDGRLSTQESLKIKSSLFKFLKMTHKKL